MLHTCDQGEMPGEDETFSLVIYNKLPYWQATSGRTFPVIAGAEDPPADPDTDPDKDKAQDASPDTEKWDEERARRTIAQQRADYKALKAQLRELESLKLEIKKRDDEKLSESDRLNARVADLERDLADKAREAQDVKNRSAVITAASKAGATDPEDVFRLLDPVHFEHDEQGNLTNADKLVKELLTHKPYLQAKRQGEAVPATPKSNGQQTHEDRVQSNREKLMDLPQYRNQF